MNGGIKIRAEKIPFHRGVSFYIFRDDGRKIAAIKEIVWKEIKENERIPDSSMLTLSDKCAQELFDNLWHAGFRPESQEGNEGALKATQNHLEDMRKMVFDYLDKGFKYISVK